MVKLLVREWRRRSTHGGESGWIPWRVAAAGVEEGDLLGALPVARRALGEVQGWWVLELKLGASIYRQIDGVAVNGESPASDYGEAVAWQRVRWPGSTGESYWSHSTTKLGRAWRNGVGLRRGRRTGTAAVESVLRA